ncbi:YkvA family protein [Sporolactobacillus sp. Y61]|uniref:YkvA family protein n=1 Tax=Sporolactobacillus sp. Y61 TaxID=3160863 RepID=A0AAU8IFV2_9BACL
MVCESLCLCIVACAFNPIDPIPDFIPIPRYLDEFIITPFALMLAVKCIPESVMTDAKIKTQQRKRNTGTPKFRTAVSGFSACTDSVLDFLILALILRPDDLCIRSDLRHFHRIMA